jgi:hypothetical protein
LLDLLQALRDDNLGIALRKVSVNKDNIDI